MKNSDPIGLDLIRRARRWAAASAIALAALAPAGARADSVDLAWTAPGDDGNAGRAAGYELRYATNPVAGVDTLGWWNGATSAGVVPPPLQAGAREQFTVIGLTTGVTYYFMIRTRDEVPNWSGFSNLRARQPGSAGGTLATPASFAATMVPGGVRLTWEEPASGAGNGYRLYRRVSGGVDTLRATLPVVTTAYVDSSVAGGVSYEYRIATYQGATEGVPAVAAISTPTDLLETVVTSVHGFPNPARDRVTIRYQGGTAGGASGRVRVIVYDLTGRKIRQLLDEVVPAGAQSIDWNCRSDSGSAVAPGLYNVIVDAPSGRSTTQLAILP